MLSKRPGGRQIVLTLFGLLLTFVAAWHAYYSNNSEQRISVLNSLERYAYDLRLRASVKPGLDPRIIIVDIDEESLRRIGQWPWPRAQIAKLANRLFTQYSIDTLGFDIVFSEPETSYPAQTIEKVINSQGVQSAANLMQALSIYQGDKILADVLSERTVLGYFFEKSATPESVGVLPGAIFSASEILGETHAPIAGRYSGSVPLLQQAAKQAGFFSLVDVADIDGIIRRVALLNRYEDKLYGALPLIMARQYLGSEIKPILASVAQDSEYTALEGLSIDQSVIPLDAQAAVYVPYHQQEGAYRSVPAWQVLSGSVENPDSLAGTLVLIGASAAGLQDLRNTPLKNAFPGVEIHANLLSGLLDGEFRSQPGWVRNLNIVLIVIIGSLLSLLLPAISIAKSTVLAGLVFVAILLVNLYFWFKAMWVVPIATISVLIWLLYSFNTLFGFFAESRSRQIMRSMFGLYIPSEIVDEMSETPDVYSLKSEKREMTVMFSDVRDFTSISEGLSPEELSELLNTLLTPITEIIHRNQGAIDKYMGDAVMAFWGAPVPIEEHAKHAIHTALEITEKLKQINLEFAARDWPLMRMGIGISTGQMNVGNMGSAFRMAYTVLGDSVNLGSRLEGLSKLYGVEIIVSEKTCQAADEFVYYELDIVRVKGKKNAEKIYTPIVHANTATEIECHCAVQLKIALAHYREQNWQESLAVLESLKPHLPKTFYQLYRERILARQESPPAVSWDGVTTLVEK